MLLNSKNLYLPGSRKFSQRWVGPFRVVARVGPLAYRLDMSGRFDRVHPVFHVSLLKSHTAGGSSAGPPEPVEIAGHLEYQVERILRHRGVGARRRYQVRWVGYDDSEDTWLSEEDLANALDVLAEYLRRSEES